ncbi:NADH dehydrogenase [ubiquinone] 1 beta subcomplex subunit 3 [Belonocnema kinseyi]|uniref:NADH dehydrogenase [ubiquinone] 1 beta subcomplex subunit 3 n=1 Tax=Belonocnema kinseyi TaxID=2817044 RepID=UPI00143CEAD3|nr:NADH dehydrogenase [ubiquinone] 1 beta subcomplex subunit 3 [Belonocnema kinseyi]
MGGDGHGHGHGPPYKVPSHEIYKWEDVPELKKMQEKLAKLGLKDPWARNEVWRYHKGYGTQLSRGLNCLFRGWRVAIPAFIITIAAEKALGINYGGGHH